MADAVKFNMHSSLQSKYHGQLLDVIDLLRSQGVSRYVPLPQLIVCGDQSSGKSSVLEAISGVQFPTKDSLCTRFATEVILRRDSTKSASVTITPGSERSDDERKKLLEFKPPTVDFNEFPSLIEGAKKAMGLSETEAFSDDVLKVEISGPEQPHLTLVDLPGLIHAGKTEQSAKDVELVSLLVRSYMAKTRSIILAIVSAKNDSANQVVTRLARDFDPKGNRTLGIITKPDTLHVGSDSERDFQNLAMNKDVVFRLGWHVLRNRDYDTKDCSVAERDEKEKDFFSKGIWTSLPMPTLGISALKPRLSTVLKDQIVSELPSLIHDVEVGIDDCRKRLSQLGEPRGTLHEQRRYLSRISQSFTSLIKATVDGVYTDDFFDPAETELGFNKRLRAVMQDLLLQFAKSVHLEGHDQEIVEKTTPEAGTRAPKQISRSDYTNHVRELMRRTRGCELPGTFNPLIVGDLFYKQSRPWKRLVEVFSQKILSAITNAVRLVLAHTADETTREGLQREVVDPSIERYTRQLDLKVQEILRPHQKGHPITYNHYFIQTIQKARREHARREQAERLSQFFSIGPEKESNIIDRKFKLGELLDALNQYDEVDMDRFACSEAIYCMEAYYKVRVLIDWGLRSAN